MGDFQHETPVDSTPFTNPDDPAVLGSSFDEIYPFDIPRGDFADAPQADAPFDFDNFDFDQPALQGIDSGSAVQATPQPTFPDERYVPFPSPAQTHPASIWRPIEQPLQQSQYPDPEIFSHLPNIPTPYYPLQPLPIANPATQHNFQSITPPAQQLSSIDRALFLDGNMGPPSATAGPYLYQPIPTYPDNAAFNPDDLTEDLIATAIREGWTLPTDTTPSKRPRSRRAKQPHTLLPTGEVKKGRPCAKPQTEERRRVNQRRMEGYYRRKYDQGNLEKARQQSRESYWRRKQRRIEKGEKVRSYNTVQRRG